MSMRNFFDCFQTAEIDKSNPWLILGKGPSFSKRNQFDLSPFNTLSLNHAVREQAVTIAHIIDLDVVYACGDAIEKNAQFLVMPWVPHVNNRAGSQNLSELTQKNSLLNLMDEQGRLLWYNLSTTLQKKGDSPVIPVRFFSAEAAINLLAKAGVRQIRSLGVDGGASYSNDFDDLKDKTLLANKWKSFDRQFAEIARTILATGIDYAPLDIESPIHIFVAATEAQMLSVKVLEYSIRKHASMSVEVFPLHCSRIEIPVPKSPHNRSRTPFSFQRFLIPAIRGYQGRAIYLDSDMQVFRDIRSLWSLPFNGAALLASRGARDSQRRPQFSVMLLNCELLKWDIQAIVKSLDEGQLTYDQLMYEMSMVERIRADIDPAWNSLERYDKGETALLHYTDMNTQPWISRDNPLAYLWVRDLLEAVKRGFISSSFVQEHAKKGYIRPSLLYQIEHGIDDSFLLSKKACLLDKDFIAPFHALRRHGAVPWLRATSWLRAAARNYYQKSLLYRLERRIRNRLVS
jgi:hypothetical protein